ncbi:MAG: hypothetical protein WCR46_22525, partial [Deltaproteobacteria bacterium]
EERNEPQRVPDVALYDVLSIPLHFLFSAIKSRLPFTIHRKKTDDGQRSTALKSTAARAALVILSQWLPK